MSGGAPSFAGDDPAMIRGHFDGVAGSLAAGWAVDLRAPERTLAVEFFTVAADGALTKLGTARANRQREDLRAIGLADTHHGFDWRLPFVAREFQLSARVAGCASELPGGPVQVRPAPAYEGAIDGVAHGVLQGWAWAWDPGIEVIVEVFVDGRRRGTVPARTPRPDLAIAGIGDGWHGFRWLVPDAFADGGAHEFACRIAGTEVWLAGTPVRAAIRPGDRSAPAIAAAVVRGHAKRPLPQRAAAPRRAWYRWRSSPAGARGSCREPPCLPIAEDMGRSAATAAKPRPVRLLIPIWGADYIAAFCRTALPSLLSPNNLPFLARAHSTEVLFLTRSGERGLFDAYPAYRRLAELVPVVFTAIDDLLERFFDPFPDAYATALTHAFFRGIETVGAGACDTDFLFWNADFLAADGVFRTLAELIAAGVRCTFAPSFRVDRAIEEAVLAGRRSADGAVLDIGPREWVRLAARFRHPTVMAQTVNRFEERMIDSVNQLYWQVSDTLIVARVFLMFLLHLRPERVWERVYGHCDYVFAPEMAPAGAFHFETRSDRVLIVELQHHNREAAEIVFADAAMTPGEVAHGVARWTTREHRLASQQLVVFNGGDNEADLGAARQTTDDFMDAVYARLPAEPIWHNGHFYWRESLAALGLGYEGPGPDHPRSHLAAALRVTGYDIDLLRESWPASGGAPRELFGLALPLDPQFDFAAWLLAVQARYLAAWCDGAASPAADSDELDLISGHFHGFGWGLAEHGSDGWLRHLGPDGRATLLLRAPASRKVQVWLRGAGTSLESLAVSLNGGDPERLIPGSTAGNSLAQFKIGRDRVAAADGRLQIRFCAPPAALAASEPGCAGLAFSGITIRIG